MSSAANRLTKWIITASANEPANRRVEILRDAAVTIASPEAALELFNIAREIELTDIRVGQLILGLGNGNGHADTEPANGPQGPSPSEDVP